MIVKKVNRKTIQIGVETLKEVLDLIKNREVKFQEKNFCRQN